MQSRRDVLVLIVVPIVLLPACKPGKTTTENLELTEKYTVRSGLAVAHHPKLLAPSQVNDSVAALKPAAWGPFDVDDEIFISTTKTPATAVLGEYVRILHEPFESDIKGWTETSRTAASCLGVYAGIELTATFVTKDGKKRRYWSCTFLRAPHGYKVSYAVSDAAFATDAPLLRKVVDATEILNPP